MRRLRGRTSRRQPDDDADLNDQVIDLRFGVPGRCPHCDGHANLEFIDMTKRMSRHACQTCDREWWVHESHPGVEFQRSV